MVDVTLLNRQRPITISTHDVEWSDWWTEPMWVTDADPCINRGNYARYRPRKQKGVYKVEWRVFSAISNHTILLIQDRKCLHGQHGDFRLPVILKIIPRSPYSLEGRSHCSWAGCTGCLWWSMMLWNNVRKYEDSVAVHVMGISNFYVMSALLITPSPSGVWVNSL